MDINKFITELKQVEEDNKKKDADLKTLVEKYKELKAKYDEMKTVITEIYGKCNVIMVPANFKPEELANPSVIPTTPTKPPATTDAQVKAAISDKKK